MGWLIGGVGLLGIAVLVLNSLANASVAQVKQGALWLLAGLLLGVVLVLLLTERLGQAAGMMVPLLPILVPAGRRWWARRRFQAPAGQGTTGQEAGGENISTVRTAMLAMRLDHATGLLSGRVLAGRFAGRELGEMARAEWLDLLAECRADDPESVPLLENWLDLAQPDWRPDGADAGGAMDRAGALALLGLAEGASEADIRAAHRLLMRDAHPDHGGDAAQAARLNQARDLLLG
jgi:hypothetical protein